MNRSGSSEMLHGWLGSVLSGTLGNGSVHGNPTGQPMLQKDYVGEKKPVGLPIRKEGAYQMDSPAEVCRTVFMNNTLVVSV